MQNTNVFADTKPGGGASDPGVDSQARDLAGDAKESARAAAEEGKEKGAERLKGVADTIGRVADEVAQESPAMADWVRSAAGQIDGVSRTLKEKSVSDLLTIGQDFARREPAAFIAASAFAGFALSRLLKSSTPSQSSVASAPPAPIHPTPTSHDSSASSSGMAFHPGDGVRPTPPKVETRPLSSPEPGATAADDDRQPSKSAAATASAKNEEGQSI